MSRPRLVRIALMGFALLTLWAASICDSSADPVCRYPKPGDGYSGTTTYEGDCVGMPNDC